MYFLGNSGNQLRSELWSISKLLITGQENEIEKYFSHQKWPYGSGLTFFCTWGDVKKLKARVKADSEFLCEGFLVQNKAMQSVIDKNSLCKTACLLNMRSPLRHIFNFINQKNQIDYSKLTKKRYFAMPYFELWQRRENSEGKCTSSHLIFMILVAQNCSGIYLHFLSK